MDLKALKKAKLPDSPGVYFFRKGGGKNAQILYIGKATSLRDRVKSYFANDLMKTRGRLLVDMMAQATSITHEKTDSVLEAFLLETELIKQHMPRYNTKEKDNKSFNYVVITKEDFPRVLVVRGRELQLNMDDYDYTDSFGPYPYGAELREALRLIRKIFPFRDTCTPYEDLVTSGKIKPGTSARPCFNRTIGLCPGVCTGEISKKEYAKQIMHIKLFFKGKKRKLMSSLAREMKIHSKNLEFEQAGQIMKTISALNHIQDISMIKRNREAQPGDIDPELSQSSEFRLVPVDGENGGSTVNEDSRTHRMEAYDIAHLSGKNMVGVMVVMSDGEFEKSQYKKFNIKTVQGANDTAALTEVLSRRFMHSEWQFPNTIIIDGGRAQLNAAEEILSTHFDADATEDMKQRIRLVSVVKDDRHKARDILQSDIFKGWNSSITSARADKPKELTETERNDIINLNQESHRFAIAFHKKKRSNSLFDR